MVYRILAKIVSNGATSVAGIVRDKWDRPVEFTDHEEAKQLVSELNSNMRGQGKQYEVVAA